MKASSCLKSRFLLQYLELDKDAIFDEVVVTEEQIVQRYEEEQLEYQSQIERRAAHILLEAFDDEGMAEDLALAAELKEQD